MLKICMEFKKGILFIRLDGILNRITKDKFDTEVLPLVLDNGLKYVVLNLDKVNYIDSYGVNSLSELGDILYNQNGKTTLCSLTSEQVKNKIEEIEYKGLFYETNNELTALRVMKI